MCGIFDAPKMPSTPEVSEEDRQNAAEEAAERKRRSLALRTGRSSLVNPVTGALGVQSSGSNLF